MMLLTRDLRRKIPKLYSQEHKKDPIAYVKFFAPSSNWTWYILEFDGKDTFFAYVVGLESELGYVSLRELQSVRGRWGLGIERDRHFRPTPLSKIKRGME